MTATVQETTLNDADKTPKLHWVLTSLPGPGDAKFENADALSLVQNAMKAIADNAGRCTHWVLEKGPSCSYSAAVVAKLGVIQFSQANMLVAPTSAGQIPASEVRFQYKPRADPNPTITSLAIQVTTDSFDKSKQDAVPGSPLWVTWSAAAARLGRNPPPSAGAPVPITVRFSADDLKRTDAANFEVARIQDALLTAAVAALEKAAESAFLPGSPEPSNDVTTRVRNKIIALFNLPIAGWPRPNVSLRQNPGPGDYRIQVNGLRIASGASVEILRGQIQGASGMVGFVGATPGLEKRLQDALATATKAATIKVQPQLDALTGHVPTPDLVTAARDALGSVPQISGGINLRASKRDIVLSGTRNWSIGSLNAKASLTGSFTPEDFLTGEASLDGSNLLRNVLPISVGETYNLAIQGGPEVQRSTFDFKIPRTHGFKWIWNYGFRHSFFYTRDWNQRFGNNGPSDPKLINRQEGMTPALFVEISRQPSDEFSWVFDTQLEASYDWRAVLIEPRLTGAANLLSGQLAAPTVTFKQVTGHDAKGFIGSTRLLVTAKAMRGTHALGGDYAFDQFTASARGEVYFGAQRNSDLFLRYERGLGLSGAVTPLFGLMRLGGPSNIRGLENGEFVGRNLAYDQSTAGVSVLALAGLFNKAARGNNDLSAGGFKLANVYLAGFYDRGRLSGTGNLMDVLSIGPSAHGYGFAGELHQLPGGKQLANLSIGWAKSPQSRLHTHGLLTVGVSFDF